MRTERDEIALRVFERMDKRQHVSGRGGPPMPFGQWADLMAAQAYIYAEALLERRQRTADGME